MTHIFEHLSSLGDTVGEIVGTNSLTGESISQGVGFESSELPAPSGLLSATWLWLKTQSLGFLFLSLQLAAMLPRRDEFLSLQHQKPT